MNFEIKFINDIDKNIFKLEIDPLYCATLKCMFLLLTLLLTTNLLGYFTNHE